MADTTDRASLTGSSSHRGMPGELGKEQILEEIESGPEFRQLERSKLRFILPATIFFLLYYFALPVLVGFFPEMMDTRLFNGFSVAYLFALSQFFMAWILAFIYLLSFAPKMDRLVRNIVKAVEARNVRIAKGGR